MKIDRSSPTTPLGRVVTRKTVTAVPAAAVTAVIAAVFIAVITAGCATSPAGSSPTSASTGTPATTAPTTTAATGPIPTYRLDPTHTFVHWEIVHMGTSTIRGRFDTATGSVQFDPKGKRLDVSISIDTASVDSGVKILDNLLKGPELLSTIEYPQAYFVAHETRFDGDAVREVRGEFTLRGVSQPLSLRSTRWNCGFSPIFRHTVCGGDFEAEIVRSDYGITYSLPFVADKVKLLIQVEAVAP